MDVGGFEKTVRLSEWLVGDSGFEERGGEKLGMSL